MKLPDEAATTWPCIRLVREHWDTLSEMESGDRLSIDDVDLACMVLDEVEAAQMRMRNRRANG